MFNFWSMIVIQAVIFLAAAYARRIPWSRQWRTALAGMAIGIPFGIGFDFLMGTIFHVFTYDVVQTWAFHFYNAAFSYGFFIATVLLIRHASPLRSYLAIVFVAVVYEIANATHPVWHWNLALSVIRTEALVIFVMYPALAALILAVVRTLVRMPSAAWLAPVWYTSDTIS